VEIVDLGHRASGERALVAGSRSGPETACVLVLAGRRHRRSSVPQRRPEGKRARDLRPPPPWNVAMNSRVLLPVLLLAACRAVAPQPPAAQPASQPVVEGTARTSDGVDIAYEDRGPRDASGATLVFLHGWSCNRAFWKEQLET